MPRALVTGGGGYVGTVLIQELLQRNWRVTAIDRLFFGADLFPPEIRSNSAFELVQRDIRDIKVADCEGHDVVFDLAGLSNDATSEIDPKWTRAINYRGSLKVAQVSADSGVGRYIFASSCALYGDSGVALVNEEAQVHPLTEYGKAKADVEPEILLLESPEFIPTCLRNSTVYGLSHRMRFDLVVNLMTLFAWREGRILVREGGKQWRPFVSVEDVADAMITVATARPEDVSGQIFNVGSEEQNLRIDVLAHKIRDALAEFGRPIVLEEIPEDVDRRSYRVDFGKIERVLGWTATKGIESSVKEIWMALEERRLDAEDPRWVTLSYYTYLLECERVLKSIARHGKVF